MNTRTVLCLSALLAAALPAHAADSYGYLAIWQNPKDAAEVPQIKTTPENATQAAAMADLEAFCRAKDALAGVGAGEATGCQSVVPLHNTCVAVAYPKGTQNLSTNNAVVITSPLFRSVHQIAFKQCMQKYGSQGGCAIETVYCTATDYYGGAFRTLLNRLKSF